MLPKIYLVLLLLCSSMTVSALSAQNVHKDTVPLPPKAKFETIRYKKSNYEIIGNVYKKHFVEGRKLTFMRIEPSDTIMSGTYFIKDGYSCIEGTVNGKAKGVFRVSNDIGKRHLSTDKRNTGKLYVEIVDIAALVYKYAKKYPLVLFKSLSADDYQLRIKFTYKILSLTVSPDIIAKYGFYAFDDMIKNSENVKLTYPKGDVYTGVVEKNDDTGTWGDIYFDDRIRVPCKGTTVFADGTVANGDWLKPFTFSKKEWEQIYANSNTLTEIRDNVRQKQHELDMLERKRIEAKRIAEQKRQEELRVEEQKKQAKLRAERERKQRCIAKYGTYWGNLINNREFTVGMTKEMVREILGSEEGFYVKSVSTSWGVQVETWRFSYDSSVGALIIGLADLYGRSISQYYPTLVFKNEKLTGIYR